MTTTPTPTTPAGTVPATPPVAAAPARGATLRPHRVAAAAAVVAVVARLVSIVAWPPDSDAGDARMLATAGAHPVAWGLATWAEVVAWVLVGAAVLTATVSMRGRGAVVTRVGGWVYGGSLVTLGLVGGAMNGTTAVLAAQPDRPAMVHLQGALGGSALLLPFVVLLLLGELFVVVFSAGLSRGRLVGWWYPALAVVALVAYVLTSDSSQHLWVALGFLPLALTWLVLGALLAGRRTGAVRSAG